MKLIKTITATVMTIAVMTTNVSAGERLMDRSAFQKELARTSTTTSSLRGTSLRDAYKICTFNAWTRYQTTLANCWGVQFCHTNAMIQYDADMAQCSQTYP